MEGSLKRGTTVYIVCVDSYGTDYHLLMLTSQPTPSKEKCYGVFRSHFDSNFSSLCPAVSI